MGLDSMSVSRTSTSLSPSLSLHEKTCTEKGSVSETPVKVHPVSFFPSTLESFVENKELRDSQMGLETALQKDPCPTRIHSRNSNPVVVRR